MFRSPLTEVWLGALKYPRRLNIALAKNLARKLSLTMDNIDVELSLYAGEVLSDSMLLLSNLSLEGAR